MSLLTVKTPFFKKTFYMISWALFFMPEAINYYIWLIFTIILLLYTSEISILSKIPGILPIVDLFHKLLAKKHRALTYLYINLSSDTKALLILLDLYSELSLVLLHYLDRRFKVKTPNSFFSFSWFIIT